MSIEEKIASAKPTTFLTDGLSEEEVKQAVDEGKKRSMSDTVKLIIEISKEVKADIDNGVIRQNIDKIYLALAHGTPLDDVIGKIEKLNSVDYGSMFSYESHNGARDMQRDILDILDDIGKKSEEAND